MNYNDLNKKLTELKIEDFIWIIYIAIIFLSWISNDLERKYFKFNNIKARDDYRKIITIIFTFLLVIYIYFLIESIGDLKDLKPSDTEKKKFLTFLSFIGSLLIVISGIIFLIIAVSDENIDVEIAFN